ncbi:unnamed protein product, partial [Phaeothamnion confervicola]
LGDVLIEGADLIGDGVNVAARIQHLAPPGEICLSASVHEQVKTRAGLAFDDLGKVAVKNIADPIHVYRVRLGTASARLPGLRQARRRTLVWLALGGALTAALVAGGALLHFGFPGALTGPPSSETISSHPSIAVLPFDNLSGDPAQDYFADGITEDVILALGRFSDL